MSTRGVPSRPSPAVPEFFSRRVERPKEGSQGTFFPSVRDVGTSLQAGRERIHEARHPSPSARELTNEIHDAIDAVGQKLRLPRKSDEELPAGTSRRDSKHPAGGSVPGFEKAIDKTALAEEAAVRAEAAANRALHCLRAAEQFNQESADARAAQKRIQAERAAIDDKIQLVEIKREGFQRSRADAEHKAREYEGAKSVALASEMFLREATEKLNTQTERVLRERAEVQRVKAVGDDLKQALEKLTGEEAVRKRQSKEEELRRRVEAKKDDINNVEKDVKAAEEAANTASVQADAALKAAREREAHVAELQKRLHAAEAEAERVDEEHQRMEREIEQKKHFAEDQATRLDQAKAEVDTQEQELGETVKEMLDKQQAADEVSQEAKHKLQEAETARDRAAEEAHNARRAASEARAADASAMMADQRAEREAAAAERAEKDAQKIAEEAAAARDYAEKAEAKKEAEWDEAKRLGDKAEAAAEQHRS